MGKCIVLNIDGVAIADSETGGVEHLDKKDNIIIVAENIGEIRADNSVLLFVAGYIKMDFSKSLNSNCAYKMYSTFCNNNNMTVQSFDNFNEALIRYLGGRRECCHSTVGQQMFPPMISNIESGENDIKIFGFKLKKTC